MPNSPTTDPMDDPVCAGGRPREFWVVCPRCGAVADEECRDPVSRRIQLDNLDPMVVRLGEIGDAR